VGDTLAAESHDVRHILLACDLRADHHYLLQQRRELSKLLQRGLELDPLADAIPRIDRLHEVDHTFARYVLTFLEFQDV
jgi:hypothetical protein